MTTSTERTERIDFFFAPPVPVQAGPLFSPLHLSRREVQECLINEAVGEDQVLNQGTRRRLFATVMVIMAGIDLLAKFYAGKDDIGDSGGRFKRFAKAFMFDGDPSAERFAEVMYLGCRNPILHSFTLYSDRVTLSLAQGIGRGAVVRPVTGDPNQFVISVEDLFAAFIRAINKYESALRATTDLQDKFDKMFAFCGSMKVQAFTQQARA